MVDKSVPSLPAVPSNADTGLRNFLTALKEALEVRLGQRGDPLDRSPTLRELYEGGVVGIWRNGSLVTKNSNRAGGFGGTSGTLDYSTPNAPTNLQAFTTPETVLLTWAKSVRSDITLTEVWRNDVDDQGTATLVGVAPGAAVIYSDTVGPAATFFYWVRFLTEAGVYSPYNALAGLEVSTPLDPAAYLELLSGQITETELHATLTTRLDDTDVAIATETSTRQSETGELYGQYSVKVQAVGGGEAIAGFGLSSTANTYDENTHTEAQFVVDRFSIVAPNASSASFVVDGNKVVMDAAFIKEATITDAHITTLGVNKIVGDTANFVTSNITNGSIVNAMIGNTIESSSPAFQTGVAGWQIRKDGGCEFNSGYFRGDITGANGTFNGSLSAETVAATSALLVGNIRTPLEVSNTYTVETSQYSDDDTPDTNWAYDLIDCSVTVDKDTPRVRVGFYADITYIRKNRYHYKCDVHLKRNINGAGWVTIKTWTALPFGSLPKTNGSLDNYLVAITKPVDDLLTSSETLYKTHYIDDGFVDAWATGTVYGSVPAGSTLCTTGEGFDISLDHENIPALVARDGATNTIINGAIGLGAPLDYLLARYGIYAAPVAAGDHFEGCSMFFVDYPAAENTDVLDYTVDLYVREVSGHRLDVKFGTRKMAIAVD